MTHASAPPPPQPVFDFGGRLTAAFPSQILMDITEVCNLACTHCPHPAFVKSEHYGGLHLDPALNDKMIDEVRRHGQGCTQYIRYASNGEPLAHPQAYDMIQAAVEHSGVYVTLTTNGKIMDEKRTRKLLDAGVHMIDISLDAFKPETYAKIRVKGNLAVTQGNVLRLIRWAQESSQDARTRTKVVVSFVEQGCRTTRPVCRRGNVHPGHVRHLPQCGPGAARLHARPGRPRHSPHSAPPPRLWCGV